MHILTWNLQGAVPPNGSIDRTKDQLSYIGQHKNTPEILLLNEVTTTQRDRWREGVESLGYTVVDSLDWAAELRASDVAPHQDISYPNGNLTAVHDSLNADLERHSSSTRVAYDDADLNHWSTNFLKKILWTTVDTPDRTLNMVTMRPLFSTLSQLYHLFEGLRRSNDNLVDILKIELLNILIVRMKIGINRLP